MEVSNQGDGPDGQELIETVATLTGLPKTWVVTELEQILENNGNEGKNLTLQQLREALLVYLEAIQADLMAEAGAELHE